LKTENNIYNEKIIFSLTKFNYEPDKHQMTQRQAG